MEAREIVDLNEKLADADFKFQLVTENARELLRRKSNEFDFNSGIDAKLLSQKLVNTMYENEGLGLSAIQVGLPLRVFVMRGIPADYAMFNPRIVYSSEEQHVMKEGCLSFPGLYCRVKRPYEIRVRFQGPDGMTYTRLFGGLTSRVIQHEIDHLDGIQFFDRASFYHRDKAFKDQKIYLRKLERIQRAEERAKFVREEARRAREERTGEPVYS